MNPPEGDSRPSLTATRPARRSAAVSCVLVALAVGGCSGDSWSGTPLRRAADAYAKGDWPAAEAQARAQLGRDPKDPVASRLLARALLRIGRRDDGLALETAAGAETWEAEDLFLVGRRLSESGRPALAWAAFDAAVKLDPKAREAAAALVELQGKAGSQGDVARQADKFTAVPSGAALAELVGGVLSLEKTKDVLSFDPWVDRVSETERAVLLKLEGRPAALKLLARFLLEDGRPAEARALLGRVKGHADDPEANWLLSCAELDEGRSDLASATLERSQGFGDDDPLAREPAPYTGAKACAKCHASKYQSQQQSRHAITIWSGESLAKVPLPKGPLIDPVRADVVHSFDREGSRIAASAKVGDETVRGAIAYALGSGHHGQTMLAKDETSDGYRSLRISYYTGGDQWGVTSGFPPRPEEPARYLGELMSEPAFRACLNCHTTRFQSERDGPRPEAADRGIGCERCHGPGRRHVEAVEAGFPRLAIARPREAAPAQRMRLCAPCHAADGQVTPSDPRFIRFQSTTLPYSRCYTETGGKLDCVTCHDPHKNVETSPAHYDARCLACHGEGPRDETIRVEAVAAVKCPVDAKKGCTGCHMPKSENVIPFTSFSDHHIRVHKAEGK